MTTRHAAILLACSLVTLALVPAAGAREERREYVTGADVFAACEDQLPVRPTGDNLGAACFDVQGASTVDVRIEDNFFGPIGGAIDFVDAEGEDVNEDLVIFCGSIENLDVPTDAVGMEVTVDGPAFQALDCGLEGGTATDGDVVATIE